MRWDGGCALLDRHLDRLRRSAEYFDFPFDGVLVRDALEANTVDLRPDIAHRLRLTLDRRGRVEIEAAHLAAAPLPLRNAVVFPEPVDAADPFLRHKTTHRSVYDRAFAWAQERGFDEAILLNERGEVTEGTRTNVFVRRGGRLLTPPRASGGLDGVFRAHVLATRPGAAEQTLRAADLFSADAVYLCNALRGWHEVTVNAVPRP
jgi:para-aminobenzoate synthetase/4-amino-4-deoxychorismate lyase